MGSKVHTEVHGTTCEGSLCGAPGHEKAEEDVSQEGRCDQIYFQRDEIWVLKMDKQLRLIVEYRKGGMSMYHKHCMEQEISKNLGEYGSSIPYI